ncbi:MAG: TRAP transporter small permease subunit, partial [Thermoleophilia bacterium]|nr:TRAP transporter small permease subunit [Thermoleophilia bacterium]
MVRKIDGWIGWISQFLVFISGVLVLLMAFAQTYGVAMRYIFNSPDPAAYELSQLFLLLCGVLSVAGVEKLDQNVRNDILSSRFPPRMHTIIVNTVFPFLALVFCVVLTWKSLDNALYALRIGQVTQSPWALPLAPIK